MGVCVPNFRSVSFFVWPGNVTQINTQIHIYILVKLGISLTGCSPFGEGMFTNDVSKIFQIITTSSSQQFSGESVGIHFSERKRARLPERKFSRRENYDVEINVV